MPAKPMFSIVIPTRERCETLEFSMKTVLSQTFDDFELVIMDNFSQDRTKEVVQSYQDERIRYFRTSERLSMRDNWETALNHVNGRWMIFIGDDDGLIPDSLLLSSKILNHFSNIKALKWKSGFNYWWPNVLVEHNRNMIYIQYGNTFKTLNAHSVLQHYFQNVGNEHILPMVYHGVVKTDFINSIKYKHSPYFKAVGVDSYSGVINAYFLKEFLYSDLPLSISGVSGKSNGTATLFTGEKGRELRENQLKEYKVSRITEMFHPDLQHLEVHHPQLHAMDCLLQVKDECMPDDDRFIINKLSVLNSMTYTLRFDYENYENTIEVIKKLATEWEIPETELVIPEKITPQRPQPGPAVDPNGRFLGTIAVDGDKAKIGNVYEASCLIDSIVAKQISYVN